ncbi:MAG: bifunctional UDP-3-O-[3-hydroxymyristoyl] N-acetylglucosamine deacetylase/3-hydroxyacyl-ACP dehydratase [Ignavibacteria bacterium]|nr:bifunctional UDP-3-O-[3-hydroxymyristoyl] N-acetylglucosamine deacetylase/3-hydroxyacyl-ACP dehydratase [Ignavibacteria bacterium]MBK8380356.1 bifunctional UDP-3-O-[3-hydroxymyristoyl] N-acetylglucosamine deacetylase/3-hydroxyacyl-ACP dehydratase [Ignavibacteria bacterium]MBK9405091.1 bifunctional UDP-3-O-[3-hydroxymyristoyl] N-acetylglucosamine deacetylase/3-hydroxyacyl-ACP dehydratase [Ignavibacteria bacterium]
MLEKQRTIKNPVTLSGVGLHTGNKSNMTFKPAPENSGIIFKRIDLPGSPEIPADIDHVIDISRGTTIAKEGAEVHTVEHVLASIMGSEIDNIVVELDSNEPPIMDGSAKDYVETLKAAEIVEQNAKRDYLIIEDTVHYHDDVNNVDIVALPLKDDFRISVMVDYNNPALGVQHTGLFNLHKEFEKEFAPSRTFCFLSEIEFLIEQGLIKGGDLNNAIVIVDKEANKEELEILKNRIGIGESVILGSSVTLNNKELRFKNEPARHKLLDLIGDLALIGAPVKGQILAARPGHKSNVEFTKMLRKLYLQKKIEKKFQIMKSENCIFDIEAIMEIMPHRYPFLLIDRIIELEQGKRIVGLKNVTYNEPFFNGHFPIKRIMPGVLIVEAMAQCGFILVLNLLEDPSTKMAYFASIEKVKFRKTVTPGDQLVFEMYLQSFKRGICKIVGKAYRNFIGGEVVCEGEFMAAVVDK